MLIPLPNLDDRRWSDLVEEARALIPLYAPEWTDHNVHDPGVTFTELLAWMTEAQIYRLNRISVAHRQKFLRLLGVTPVPPQAARTVLALALHPHSPPLDLPAGLEFEGRDPFGIATRFRLPEDVVAVAARIEVVRRWDGETWHDLTDLWEHHEPFAPFGHDPRPGAACYFGLSEPLPVGTTATIALTVKDDAGREALRAEAEAIAQCAKPPDLACNPDAGRNGLPDGVPRAARISGIWKHHSADLVWEFSPAPGVWQPLSPENGELRDDTRSLTLTGAVRLCLPSAMATLALRDDRPRPYLRCRFARGAFDDAPVLRDVSLNGWLVEQAVPVGEDTVPEAHALSWEIAPDATISGSVPVGGEAGLSLRFNEQGSITLLELVAGGPRWLILDFRPPVGGPGVLTIEAERLCRGTGFAGQHGELAQHPVLAGSLQLFTLEDGTWHAWQERPDFDRSTPRDRHYLLAAQDGVITFGDGWHGQAPAAGAQVVARYLATRGGAGNLGAGVITSRAGTRHNAALLGRHDPSTGDTYGKAIEQWLAGVTNPLPVTGGADAESLGDAEARAQAAINVSPRGVNAADLEALARGTPGVRLARVAARPNFSAAFPCLTAPGVVTVIVVPFLPRSRPTPSRGLRAAVATHLHHRRVLGTRIEVAGPTYTTVGVRARVRAEPGANPTEVQRQAVAAITRFFDALTGGPHGSGWPFGRDVYRYEVLQVLDETAGVSHVLGLELLANDNMPTCSHVCVGPIGLVATGDVQVEVV